MAETTTELKREETASPPAADPNSTPDDVAAGQAPSGEESIAVDGGEQTSEGDNLVDANGAEKNSDIEAEALDAEAGEISAGESVEEQEASPSDDSSTLYKYIPTAKKGTESEPVILNNRFDIFPARALEKLDTPSARAFHAEDRTDPRRRLMALVTIPGMPVRAEEIEALVEHEIPGVLPLVGFGSVFWHSIQKETMVLIYQRPMGGNLLEVLQAETHEFRRQDIINQVVQGVNTAIQQLGSHDTVHRGIRPENIFFMDEAREEVVLGDSLTAPPGYNQPILYETIGRSLANPAGRGWGDSSDDLYALGVTLAMVLLGRDPMRRMTTERMIFAKMTVGTYQMLIANTQIAAKLLEPLRGLLNDDSQFRWSTEQVATWFGGRRVSPTQSNSETKSQRGLTFGNIEHFSMRTLAHSMATDRDGSLELIQSGRLQSWLSRGLGAKELAASFTTYVQMANAHRTDEPAADDVLFSRVLMHLDPSGPIRYKGLAFMPDGFGPAMAVEYLETSKAEQSIEALEQGLSSFWYSAQESLGKKLYFEEDLYEKMAAHLKKAAPGYGLERCLYELNPGLPCLSPAINHRYVNDCKSLLLALDEAEEKVDTSKTPLDRHTAAFIATHYKGAVERYLDEAGDPDDTIKLLATLRLFAAIQDRLGPEALPGVARWLGGMTSPIIKLYQSRATRQRMESELPRLIRQGGLAPMIKLIDDPAAWREDELEFEAAVEAFCLAEEEVREIQERTHPDSKIAEQRGRQAAATVSILIMIFVISMILMTG